MAIVSIYFSVLQPPLFLFGLFLSDPDLSLQTKGFEIYDHVSDTYLESYLQKASLYLKLSLCSFAELPQHSLEDLVRCHCNSLFLMFLMFIPHHPCSLFIFPFTCFRAPLPILSASAYLKTDAVCLIEIRPKFDLNHVSPPEIRFS